MLSIFAYSSSASSQTSSSAPKELNFGNLENLESPTDSVIKDDLPECLFSDGSCGGNPNEPYTCE